jgi:DNA gyrase subunit A
MGRATQGVRLIKVREDDAIAAVAKAMKDEDDEEITEAMDDSNNGTTLDNNETQTENNE